MIPDDLRRGRDLARAYIGARRLLKAWSRVRAWLETALPSAPLRAIDLVVERHAARAQAKVEKHLFATGIPIWLRSRCGRRYIVRLDTESEMLFVEYVGPAHMRRA